MKRLVCAPMATLSHEAFRRLIERFGGCDEYFTEMINAASLLNGGPFEKYYLLSGPAPQKIVWQLTGNRADRMAAAAELLCAHGGIGIDLNMGCSAPDICKTGAGIAWMLKDRAETQAMVSAVKAAIERAAPQMRLSVKLRLGDDNFSDEGFFSFCQMLTECGVTLLTLHPRTRREKYRGLPRWHYARQLTERLHPQGVQVVLNGGIGSPQTYRQALQAAPDVDGIMIARSAVQKPWIFAELAGTLQNGPIDMQQLSFDYIADVQRYQPPEFWKTRIQRFFAYFCANFTFAHYARSQLLNGTEPADFERRLLAYFAKQPEDRYFRPDADA